MNNRSGMFRRTLPKKLLLVAICLGLPVIAWAQWTTSSNDIYNSNSGVVGIGTSTPNSLFRLHVNGALAVVGGMFSYGSDAGAYATDRSTSGYGLLYRSGGITRLNDSTFGDVIAYDTTGKVGIGTASPTSKLDVNGDVTVSGNISAKYQDFAEWVSATEVLPAGTVVALDTESDNGVVPSSVPYDTHVGGVVSDSPGIILGQAGPGKLKIATTGRVRVHVDDSNGPIQRGDLLVTGTKQGTAMRSQPIDVGGAEFHRPGTLIGKALEPLESGEGEILVLLSLQ